MHIVFERFYHPHGKRFILNFLPFRTKILIDAPSFPSDIYAMKSQIKNKGLDENEHLIVIGPREGENIVREEDILEILSKERDNICVTFLEVLNYLTGQLFDVEKITRIAREYGITVGWDLAHAIGNVPLHLNDWNVDFATFCTYKFLHAGPHTSGGLFVSRKHFVDSH
jgi:kynureninase